MIRKQLLQTASPERYTESVPGGQRKDADRNGKEVKEMFAAIGGILTAISIALKTIADH